MGSPPLRSSWRQPCIWKIVLLYFVPLEFYNLSTNLDCKTETLESCQYRLFYSWVHEHSGDIQYSHMMGLWHAIQPIHERVPSPGRLSHSPCSQNFEHSRYFFTIRPKLEYCFNQAVSLLLLVFLPRPTTWLTQIAKPQHFRFPSVYHFVVF